MLINNQLPTKWKIDQLRSDISRGCYPKFEDIQKCRKCKTFCGRNVHKIILNIGGTFFQIHFQYLFIKNDNHPILYLIY